jgi:2-polyprenyl-3-methyl-5-hydroxy-6-metoxy-1,4-benzoquinol methylase
LLESPNFVDGRVFSGRLVAEKTRLSYPISDFIPRFVPASNYADNFGVQWNKFRRTQLYSYTGHAISGQRFWTATEWKPADLAGKWVLDAGCGAGRFAEVALSSGANVVALDYSNAVDAAFANLRQHKNLHLVQGDIYALPFQPTSFSFVYSLGVLQHTPDVANAFAALPKMLQRPGGRLCVDFYERSWKSRMLPKYWLRPMTTRLPSARLFAILQRAVPPMLQLSRMAGRVPVVGRLLKRIVPVANYSGILPLSEEQLLEWALLDTFDWLSPKYDNPQTSATVQDWLEVAGCTNIEVLKAGHLVGRGAVD